MEADIAREADVERRAINFDEPSDFQVRMEEQSLIIKKKYEEAERLKIHLEQKKKKRLKRNLKDNNVTDIGASLTRGKVRAILTGKSDIKAALIAGAILDQPLALRKGTNSKAVCFKEG